MAECYAVFGVRRQIYSDESYNTEFSRYFRQRLITAGTLLAVAQTHEHLR